MRIPVLPLLFSRSFRTPFFSTFIAAFFLTCAQICHAVMIDFDDILHVPTDGFFDDQPITNEYASKGLLVSDGYLIFQSDLYGVSSPNALIGGPSLRLSFIGNLPTFVEFTVSAPFGQASFVAVNGPSGYLFTKRTNGYTGPDDTTTYIPNELMQIQAAGGISSLDITAFFGMRSGSIIDNLHFEYKKLPEPSSLVLLLMGLGLLACRWRKVKS